MYLFLLYTTLTVALGRCAFRLPSFNQAVPLGFVITLLSIADLEPTSAILVALIGAVANKQLQRVSWRESVASFASAVTAAGAAAAVFHLPVWAGLGAPLCWRIGSAALAYYAGVLIAVTLLARLLLGRPLCLKWGFEDSLSAAFYASAAVIVMLTEAARALLGWPASLVLLPVAFLLFQLLRRKTRMWEVDQVRACEWSGAQQRTVETLAAAIGSRDGGCASLERMQLLAREIGAELQLSECELEALRMAAILHDVGKLAIPDHIIAKPGKLTSEEFEKVQAHSQTAADLVQQIEFPFDVFSVVQAHHEKWDGSGYPLGLEGDNIPIGARILALVDVFDALLSRTPYRGAMTPTQALEIVRAESGLSFDPQVVETFTLLYPRLETFARDTAGGSLLSPSARGGVLEQIESAKQEPAELMSLCDELSRSLDVKQLAPRFARKLKELVPYDCLVIHCMREDELVPEFVFGGDVPMLYSINMPAGVGITGSAVAANTAIVNHDPRSEPATSAETQTGCASIMVVPLTGVQGFSGALSLYRRQVNAFTQDDLRITIAVAPKLGRVLENAIRFHHLESTASVDFITGLPNSRSLFLMLDSEVARCQRSGRGFGVLVCDINGFKTVNDQFGHLMGNRLLERAGIMLRQVCGDVDYVARLGGDEFVVIAPDCAPDEAQGKIRALDRVIRTASTDLLGSEKISLSAGCVFFPEDASTTEGLLAEADRRMYVEKHRRRLEPLTDDDANLGLVELSLRLGTPR